MPTRLPASGHQALTRAALLLLLGTQPLAAQPPGLKGQSSPDLQDSSRPGLLTANPINQVLPAERAFALDARLDANAQLQLHWDIAPGYYLYRKSLKLGTGAGTEATLELPPGTAIEDEFLGAVEVYYGQLDATADAAPLVPGDGILRLLIEYQGCAAERYCYPPQRKELVLAAP